MYRRKNIPESPSGPVIFSVFVSRTVIVTCLPGVGAFPVGGVLGIFKTESYSNGGETNNAT